MPRSIRPPKDIPASLASCSIPAAPPLCSAAKWWRCSDSTASSGRRLGCCAASPRRLLACENALRQLHMDTEVRFVHQLRNGHIPRDAHELVGLMTREVLIRNQEIHHLLNGSLG